MELRDWKPAVVTPSKFEAQLLADVLRNAGVANICVFTDAALAWEGLHASRGNLLFVGVDGASDPQGWVRQLRRATGHPMRKAPVFMISAALTMTLAESFRHAGANAIIGKPISTAALLNTIRKVLANPRPFIEGANYVGPCRRAGIVTAGTGKHRRQSDAAA